MVCGCLLCGGRRVLLLAGLLVNGASQAQGSPFGSPITVGVGHVADLAIAVDRRGDVAVAWVRSAGVPVVGHPVRSWVECRFRRAGGRFGPVRVVAPVGLEVAKHVDAAIDGSGRMTLAWLTHHPSNYNRAAVHLSIGTRAGCPQGNATIDHKAAIEPLALAVNAMGRGALLWTDHAGRRALQVKGVVRPGAETPFSGVQALSGAEAPVRAQEYNTSLQPQVAVSPGGEILAVWRQISAVNVTCCTVIATAQTGATGGFGPVQSLGAPESLVVGGPGQPSAISIVNYPDVYAPQVEAVPDGSFLVAWARVPADGKAEIDAVTEGPLGARSAPVVVAQGDQIEPLVAIGSASPATLGWLSFPSPGRSACETSDVVMIDPGSLTIPLGQPRAVPGPLESHLQLAVGNLRGAGLAVWARPGRRLRRPCGVLVQRVHLCVHREDPVAQRQDRQPYVGSTASHRPDPCSEREPGGDRLAIPARLHGLGDGVGIGDSARADRRNAWTDPDWPREHSAPEPIQGHPCTTPPSPRPCHHLPLRPRRHWVDHAQPLRARLLLLRRRR